MGVVYAAFDRERGEECAIKTLRSLDADSLYRLKSEFRALADVDHPNLVRLSELVCDGDVWFLAMELVRGQPFLEAVRRDGAVDVDRLRAALGQLAAGVLALHAAGKVHRDLKPANVLVEDSGRVVILDFGLITESRRPRTMASGDIVGTAAYMAPEQAASAPVTPAIDWYAIGIMLYEALAEKLPFQGSPLALLMQKIDRDPEPLATVAPQAPAALSDLAMRLLARDPAERAGGDDILAVCTTPVHRHRVARESLSRRSTFVGRQAELLALERAFSEAAGPVLVCGPSGVGKTSLAGELSRVLREKHRVAALHGRCYERESVPYKGLDEIIDRLSQLLGSEVFDDVALPADLDAITRVFPVLRRVRRIAEAQVDVVSATGHELRQLAVSALRALFAEVAKKRAPVLFIDDLQWANSDSLALLRELCAPPLFVVGTIRTDGDDDPIVAKLARTLGCSEVITLGGLTPSDATALAETLWEQASISATAFDPARVAREAGGHPLFMDVLIRHLVEGGETSPEMNRLETAIASRIADLDGDGRALLTSVAVAGAPISQRIATAAAAIDPAHASRIIARLRAMRLVRTAGATPQGAIQAYHDRIREAALSRIDDDASRAAYASLIAAIEASGETIEPARMVRYLVAAGDLVGAAAASAEAADRATSTLAFENAAELYETSLRLGTHSPEARRSLLVKRAAALANASLGLEAADVYVAAATDAPANEAMALNLRAADQWLRYGFIDRGMKVMREAMTAMKVDFPDTPARAVRSLMIDRLRLSLTRLSWTHKDDADIDPDLLRRLDLYSTLGLSLGFIDPLSSACFRLRGLRLGLRLGATSRITLCLTGEVISRAHEGNFASAERMLRPIRACAETGDVMARALSIAAGSAMQYARGFPAQANLELRECLALLRRDTTGTDWQIAVTRLFHLFSVRDAGLCADLCAAYDRYVKDAMERNDQFSAATIMRMLNRVWLIRDRADEGERELTRIEWAPTLRVYDFQRWYELISRAELAVYRGPSAAEVEAFETGYDEARRALVYRVQTARRDTVWVRGRLALAFAHEGGAAMIRRAVDSAKKLDRMAVRCGPISATLLYAGIAHYRGQLERARALYEKTAAGDHELGLLAMAARRRWGELCGGDAGARLIDEANQWMISEGIVSPDRMTQLIAPAPPK